MDNLEMEDPKAALLESDDLLEGVDPVKRELLESDDLLDGIEEQEIEDNKDGIIDKLESILGGAAQGSTMGFADELGGAFQTGLDTLHSLVGGDSVTDVNSQLAAQGFTGSGVGPTDAEHMYKQGQQEAKAHLDQLKENNPGSFLGGELAGGITSGLMLPGAQAEGIAGMAKAGAQFGALQGLGESDADITADAGSYLKELGGDALTGATAGAALGGALGTAGKGVSKLGKWLGKLGDNSYLKGIKRAYKLGEEGYEIRPANKIDSTDPNKLNPLDLKENKIQDLTDRIINADKALGKNVGESLNKAHADGKIINIDDELESALKDLGKIEKDFMEISGERELIGFDDLLQRMKSAKKMTQQEIEGITAAAEQGKIDPDVAREMIANSQNGITPLGAKGMLDELESMIGFFRSRKDLGQASHRTIKRMEDFRNQLSGMLKEEIPEYAKASERMYNFRKNIPEVLMGKGESGIYNTSRFSSIKPSDRPKKVFEKLDQAIDDLALSQQNKVGSTKVRNIRSYLNDIEKTDPEVLEQMGFKKADEFVDKIDDVQELTDVLARGKAANKLDPNRSTNLGAVREGLGATFGDRFVVSGANKLGLSANNGVLRNAKSLYNAPAKTLKSVADKLSSSNIGGLGRLGETLNEAIKNGDQSKIKSSLFVILQRPDARKALGYEIDKKDK